MVSVTLGVTLGTRPTPDTWEEMYKYTYTYTSTSKSTSTLKELGKSHGVSELGGNPRNAAQSGYLEEFRYQKDNKGKGNTFWWEVRREDQRGGFPCERIFVLREHEPNM